MCCRQLTFVLFLLCLPCSAQHSRYSLDFTVSRHHFVDTIGFEYERGQIILPVSFNGETYRFLFDTGASQTTLFDDVPINGTSSLGFTISHDAIAARDTVNKMLLPPMTIGSLTFTGCHATVQHRIANNSSHIDGIIGFDIICKGINAKIDIRSHQLILSDLPDFFDKESGYTMRYKLNLHVPYVEVCPFGKYRELALFDTGSRQLYMMNKNSFDRGVRKAKTDISSQIAERTTGRHAISHGGVEPRGEIAFLALSNMQFGQYAFHNLYTMTTQGGSHLGTQLLDYGTVSFNPHRRHLHFCPYNGRRYAVVANELPEQAVIPVDSRPVFGFVRKGTTPYEAGFREGDLIIMIDRRPVNTFSDYLRFRPIRGHTYTFLVRNSNGCLKEISMKF